METAVIEIDCPHCGDHLKGSPRAMGRTLACPNCHKEMTIPMVRPAVDEGVLERRSRDGAPPVEEEIFCFRSAMKANMGELVLGILLVPVVLGVFLILHVWLKARSLEYRLTTERLQVRRGLIARHAEEVELYRIKDIIVDQTVNQRLVGVGTLTILSADESTPKLVLTGVPEPERIKDRIREQVRLVRRREHVSTGELMPL